MAVRKDKVQLEVEINGQKAGETFNDLVNKGRNLNRELGNLTPGTQQFITKATELKAVNSTLADIRNTTKGVAEANQTVPGSYQATIDTVNRLEAELRQLAPSSQAFIDKATEIGRVKDELDGIKNATDKITNANKVVPGSYQAIINRADQLEKEILLLVPSTQKFIDKSRELRKVNAEIDKVKNAANGLGGVLGRADNFLSKFGLSLKSITFAGILVGLANVGNRIFDVTKKFGTYIATLTTATGSQREANIAFSELKKLATETVFSLDEVTQGYIKMRNRGLDPTKAELKSLLDLAASQGKTFDQLVEAILDASTGENERLKEFGIRAKKSGDQATLSFRGFNDTVALTPDAMLKAIVQMGRMDGILGSNANRMQELEGQQSNIIDGLDQFFAGLGDRLKGVFSGGLGVIGSIVSKLNEWVQIPLSEKIQEEQVELNVLVGRITDANVSQEERNRLIAELDQNYPFFLENMDREKISNEQLTVRLREVNQEYLKRITLTAQQEKLEKELRKTGEIKAEIVRNEINQRKILEKTNRDLKLNVDLTAFDTLEAKTQAVIAALKNAGANTDVFAKSFEGAYSRAGSATTSNYDKIAASLISNINLNEEYKASLKKAGDETEIYNTLQKELGTTIEKQNQKFGIRELGNSPNKITPVKPKATTAAEEKEENKRVTKRLLEIDNQAQKEINIELEKVSKKEVTEEQFEINKLNITKRFADTKLEYLAEQGRKETKQYLDIEEEKFSIAKKINEETLKLKKSEIDTELSKIDNNQSTETNIEAEKLNQRLITEEQFEINKLTISRKYADEKISFLERVGEQESEVYRKTISERLDIQKDINEKELEQRINTIESSTQTELNEEQKKFIAKITNEEQFELNKLRIIEQGYANQLQLLQDLGLKETELYKKIEDDKLKASIDVSNQITENKKRTAEIEANIEKSKLQLTKDALTAGIELLSADENARKKHASAIKAFETANILVNLKSEISGYFAGFSKLPFIGQVLAIGQSAVATVRAYSAIRQVQSQKFAGGGKIKNYPGLQQPDIITLPDGTEIDATQANRNKRNSLVGRIKERFFPSEVEQSQPGVIKAKPNIPRQSNGDNVLIAARPGETILNEGQVEKAKAYAGPDFFRRIGVPGFADGGRVGGPLPGLTPKVSPVSNLSPAVLPNTQPIILNNLAGNNDAMMEVANKFDAAVTRLEKMDIKAKMVYSEFEQIKKDVDYIRGQANS